MTGGDEVFEGWVTTRQASDLTGYSIQAIRWIAKHKQARVGSRRMGRAWLVSKDDILRYKAEMDALGDQRHDPRRNPQWIRSKRGGQQEAAGEG